MARGDAVTVDKEKEKDKKATRVSGASGGSEGGVPQVGPYNRALGEIYQQLYPEMRRPKPNQEAIAAALQAMQRLTMEADAEAVANEVAVDQGRKSSAICGVCGHGNREGNKFCGACGLPLEKAAEAASAVADSPFVTSTASDLPGRTPSTLHPAAVEEQEASESSYLAPGPVGEVHPEPGAPAGGHYYHHHYHHHYFQVGSDGTPAPRANASESAREADRLRISAAAKGEHMSRSEAAVRRLTQEWILACNMRQLDELIELYAADAMVLRSNIPPIRGAVAVREFFFASLEAGLGEVALDPLRVEVAGDCAHEVGRYSALVPGTAGKRREERGKYLWVFSKQANADWRLIAECWCSDLTLSAVESDFTKVAMPLASNAPKKTGLA
jgi:ketosteroid isomerase-like protein